MAKEEKLHIHIATWFSSIGFGVGQERKKEDLLAIVSSVMPLKQTKAPTISKDP